MTLLDQRLETMPFGAPVALLGVSSAGLPTLSPQSFVSPQMFAEDVGAGLDDTAAIQAAINAVSSGGGGVFIPPGVYNVKKARQDTVDPSVGISLDVPSNVLIFSNGGASITCLTERTSLFSMIGVSNSHVLGLELIGDGIAAPHQSMAVRIRGASRCSVTRSVIHAWGSHGIIIRNGSSNCLIADNEIYGSVNWNGVEIFVDCEGNIVRENYIHDCGDQGVEIKQSHRNIVKGNIIKFCGFGPNSGPRAGVGLEAGSSDNLITGNVITGCAQYGVQIIQDCNENIVSGNTIDGRQADGVTLTANDLISVRAERDETVTTDIKVPDGNLITGNVLKNGGAEGVQVVGAPTTTVSGNKIRNCANDGVQVIATTFDAVTYRSENSEVVGNTIAACGRNGIYVRSSENLFVDGNRCRANGTLDRATAGDGLNFALTDGLVYSNNIFTGNRYGVRGDVSSGVMEKNNRFLNNETGARNHTSVTYYGAQEYLTSIAASPTFAGQKAIVSGIIYEASGTASPSDWKQISN